jgi:hypothetical protein
MSESTRTTAVAGRVEPIYADALRAYAESNGQTVSSVVAEIIRSATVMQVRTRNPAVSTIRA